MRHALNLKSLTTTAEGTGTFHRLSDAKSQLGPRVQMHVRKGYYGSLLRDVQRFACVNLVGLYIPIGVYSSGYTVRRIALNQSPQPFQHLALVFSLALVR